MAEVRRKAQYYNPAGSYKSHALAMIEGAEARGDCAWGCAWLSGREEARDPLSQWSVRQRLHSAHFFGTDLPQEKLQPCVFWCGPGDFPGCRRQASTGALPENEKAAPKS